MGKHIFEEGPRRGHAAGDTSIEQQASQLASDIKYKARQKMKGKSGSNMSPGQVQQLYRSLLSSSPAPGAVKSIAKKKLFGEQVDLGITPVSEHVKDSASSVFTKVFLEGADQKFIVRVTDKATGNTSYRKADRAKIAELRANKNISSVEITGRKKADDAYDSEKGGKKAKKDYDGDGKVESGSKEHAGVVHNAIQRKKGGVADGQDTRKEEYVDEAKYVTFNDGTKSRVTEIHGPFKKPKPLTPLPKSPRKSGMEKLEQGRKAFNKSREVASRNLMRQEEVIYEKEENGEKKLDVMKGKNTVKINPTIGESIRAELDALKLQRVAEAAAIADEMKKKEKSGLTPEQRKQLQAKDQMLRKKIMLQKQQMQMQKQGRLPLNYSEEADSVRYCPKCDKDETRDECKYGGEYWDENSKPAKAEDPRSVPTVMNLTRNKLRAMGLKMSYDMNGEMTESAEDRLRDFRQERGGVDGNKRYDRPPARKSTNKELGIRDFTPAEKEKRAKEITAHLKKMRR